MGLAHACQHSPVAARCTYEASGLRARAASGFPRPAPAAATRSLLRKVLALAAPCPRSYDAVADAWVSVPLPDNHSISRAFLTASVVQPF